MKLKFRYLDPFEKKIIYSANFENLSDFFKDYETARDEIKFPELQIVVYTSESGIETWRRCSHEEVKA